MSYKLKVIKDHPIGFWMLEETSGSVALDSSGCGNNGTYSGSPATNMLPLVSGGISGTKIDDTSYISFPVTKDFYGANVGDGFGTSYTSDNDFTLEAWFTPSIYAQVETPIFADYGNSIGLYWEDGDIIFKVSTNEYVRYRIPYSQKVFHIVGIYSVTGISLYIDSAPVASKKLSSFKFTNTAINLKSGPTQIQNDSFLIDAVAAYRYSLQESVIRQHYIDGNITNQAIHIVYPDNGVLFSGTDANIRASFDYSYPVSKQWTKFVDDNTYYDPNRQCITFYKTEQAEAKTFILEDFFTIPSQLGLNTSKIEWRNDLGIIVETSTDGTTYSQCLNGQPLPQYNKDSFDSSGNVYIKITMSTSDASKFLPRLSFFCITFYSDRTIYADNYGDKITSSTDYYLGSLNYPILSRNYMNGIRPKNNSGFNLETGMSVKSLEMVFTPHTLNSNTLFYAPYGTTTRFAWNGSGAISKANISKVYINNIDISSASNISNYLVRNEPHHIVLVFSIPVSGTTRFNYEVSAGSMNLYKNIAIYPTELTASKVETHFNLYTGNPATSTTNPTITLTELDPKYYNNDWVVVQSI